MAPDDEDSEDLYDDEFDFVDEDGDEDDESDLDDDSDVGDSEVGGVAEDDSDNDRAASDLDDEPAPREAAAKRPARDDSALGGADDADRNLERNEDTVDVDEPYDDVVRSDLPTDFRVHVYEYQQLKRTIDRPFTAEDAEAFASEYNRTSKSYGRFALAGKEDVKPKKTLS